MHILGFFRGHPLRAAGIPAAITAVTTLACIGLCSGYPCVTTGLRYGVWLDQCPTSDLRLAANLHADDLVREQWGNATVRAEALFVYGTDADPHVHRAPFTRGLAVDLALLDSSGAKVPGLQTRNPERRATELTSELMLPDVPDGDYVLRAIVASGFETRELLADLPLYAPALVHGMSDRPLYKPGQEVLLRAAVLRRSDSSPLEDRPGTWRVVDPDGVEMLVEKQPTGPWGIAATTFPLDSEAMVGTWMASYETGNDSDTMRFEVKPFKLPRFTVELEPNATWYGHSDEVEVSGTARYTSGAPVASASVTVNLAQAGGRWPMPLRWEEPLEITTDREGQFTIRLDEVPSDLMERAQVQVRARVTDEAGETAFGGAVLKLSADTLHAAAVTELGDGLVESFNNRAYVRVTRPDGTPMANTALVFRNPYDPSQPEREAQTDSDGVAAMQLDPGKPVTIVDPAPPVRQRPLVPADPLLSAAMRQPAGEALDLAERRALDRAHPAVAACGWMAVGGAQIDTDLWVDGSGEVRDVVTPDTALGRCMANAVRSLRFPRGEVRSYDLTWAVPDSLQPHFEVTRSSILGATSRAEAVIDTAAVRARRCLPRGSGIDNQTLYEVHWIVRKGSRALTTLIQSKDTAGLPASTRACVRRSLDALALAEPAKADAMGVSSLHLSVPQAPGTVKPQATTRTGFAFEVATVDKGLDTGKTRLVFPTGTIPRVRLRPTPSLASPGGTIEIEVFRGPDFTGELPEKLRLMKGTVRVAKAPLDPKTRKAVFTVPADVEGFLHVEWNGARAVIFVKPTHALSVALSTDSPSYRPGETAVLTVQTKAGDAGAPAAVSLAGVDKTLAQLAPLLGPDDWGRVTVRASGEDAFDAFGARALQLGQIRGENAALAAVLKVQNLPMDAAGDQPIDGDADVTPDTTEALVTSFYRGLEALVGKVRAWEKATPKGETITAEQLSAMWDAVLAEAGSTREPIVDAWGRPLALHSLPRDLLDQTDPRQVIADSTRLPEDVTNWPAWVQEHAP